MKVKSKDEIITCLIDILSNPVPEEQRDYLIDAGWIESLKWVLGLTEEEKNVFKEQKDIESNS
tara:strand:+ start:320 stop:508 length:189 start_codon:yes stop_codon:yes gene_type:complete